jgi:hypothetical protein
VCRDRSGNRRACWAAGGGERGRAGKSALDGGQTPRTGRIYRGGILYVYRAVSICLPAGCNLGLAKERSSSTTTEPGARSNGGRREGRDRFPARTDCGFV